MAKKHLDGLIERLPELDYLREPMCRVAESICTSYKSGGKVMVCGNGGSAADSEHIVGELMKGFVLRRELPPVDVERLKPYGNDLASKLQQGIPAIALTGHPALSTAIINDTDPLMTFAQQVYVLGKPNDVLLALSTSGNARNVINAIKVARAFRVTSVVFTGEKPAESWDLADIRISVPIAETYRVQEYHVAVYHCLCLMVEAELFGGG